MSKDEHRDNSNLGGRPLNRRNVLLGGTTLAAASAVAATNPARVVRAQEVLPLPEPPFRGIIGRTYKDSVPDKFRSSRLRQVPPTSCSF
jgi:hypothetical protein